MKKEVVVQDLEARLTQLELQIENVRTLYEQYFAGVLKRIPMKEHDQLKLALRGFPPQDIKTTAARFRYQSLKTRHLNYSNLWNRTIKEIEEGTYRRELQKLKTLDKIEATTTSKTPPPATPKQATQSPFDLLYKKFAEAAGAQNQKVPSKQNFVKALQTQIDAQKAKSPGAKFELKLQKDESGKYQVKLKVNRSAG